SPATIANLVARAQPTDTYAWGYFLGRMLIAADKGWREQLKASLPRNRILALASECTASDVYSLGEYLQNLSYCDFELATECLTNALPAIKQLFADNPMAAIVDTNRIRWHLLGFPLFERARPSRLQRKLSKEMLEGLSPETVARGIETCRYGDWAIYSELLGWVQEVSPAQHREIVEKLNLATLDRRIGDMWHDPPRELRVLLCSLTAESDGNPVREWIEVHADGIRHIDPLLAILSPESAVAVVNKGGRFDLSGHNGSDWDLQMHALVCVEKIDTGVAARAAIEALPNIVKYLEMLGRFDCEHLAALLTKINELAPGEMHDALRRIDRKAAFEAWPKALLESRRQGLRQASAVLRFIKAHRRDD